jgi:phosphotriesterase-related protein
METKKIIRTVLGDIDPQQMGVTDCHAHTLCNGPHQRENMPQYIMDDYGVVLQEVMAFRGAGGNTFTEASPIAEGRPTKEVVQLSVDSGCNVLAATGFHVKEFYLKDNWHFDYTAQQLTDVWVTELTKGMYVGTETHAPEEQIPNRAGFIKIGCDDAELSELDNRRFSAAVDVQKQTDASILCHTGYYNPNAITVMNKLLELGAKPEKVILGHADPVPLPYKDYIFKLAEAGCFVEFDCFTNAHPGADRSAIVHNTVKLIKAFIEAGFEDRVVLGSDVLRPGFTIYGGDGFGFLPGIFRRWLYGCIDPKIVNKFYIDNPARAFAMKAR